MKYLAKCLTDRNCPKIPKIISNSKNSVVNFVFFFFWSVFLVEIKYISANYSFVLSSFLFQVT